MPKKAKENYEGWLVLLQELKRQREMVNRYALERLRPGLGTEVLKSLVDGWDLFREVFTEGGFAGPPLLREAQLLKKRANDSLGHEEWESNLRPIWLEQMFNVDALWCLEKDAIGSLRLSHKHSKAGNAQCLTGILMARLAHCRAARLAAHYAAASYGRDQLKPLESYLSKAEIRGAERWHLEGEPIPFVLFDGLRPVCVSVEAHDWFDDWSYPAPLPNSKKV